MEFAPPCDGEIEAGVGEIDIDGEPAGVGRAAERGAAGGDAVRHAGAEVFEADVAVLVFEADGEVVEGESGVSQRGVGGEIEGVALLAGAVGGAGAEGFAYEVDDGRGVELNGRDDGAALFAKERGQGLGGEIGPDVERDALPGAVAGKGAAGACGQGTTGLPGGRE